MSSSVDSPVGTALHVSQPTGPGDGTSAVTVTDPRRLKPIPGLCSRCTGRGSSLCLLHAHKSGDVTKIHLTPGPTLRMWPSGQPSAWEFIGQTALCSLEVVLDLQLLLKLSSPRQKERGSGNMTGR